MFAKIIAFSVREKTGVFAAVLLLAVAGIYALGGIPVDAVPDITNNQVQVVTTSQSLTAEDVERFITIPIELRMANLPGVEGVRSISRFGLSIVTVIFSDEVPVMRCRQMVGEQLAGIQSDVPPHLGSPSMMPITTGLGEIYQYTLEVDPAWRNVYDATYLRSLHDWVVKRKLAGIEGVVEISSFGGFVKQYEVAVRPARLNALDIGMEDLIAALQANNANAGGSYITSGTEAVYIRSEGLLRHTDDLRRVPVAHRRGIAITTADAAEVRQGHAPRYGALTRNGEGEAVGGITLMLKGANARNTVAKVKERVEEVQSTLPQGIRIVPYLDRSELVNRSIATAVRNLVEGGLIVGFILVFFLGSYKMGLLVASVIPLSMLFALVMMRIFGLSANLMSLGAIDFGIVVDGAIIIVEGVMHAMAAMAGGVALTKKGMDKLVIREAGSIYQSAAFGVLIILVVFVPVLQLGGVEGKMFRPMALTLMFALGGGMLLSLTYVPAAAALLLKDFNPATRTYGNRVMEWMRRGYSNRLERALPSARLLLLVAVAALALTVWRMAHMGALFLPDLEEGDLAMQMAIPPGSSLDQTIAMTTEVERLLMERFPEVKAIVSKIGTAEIPTDPMAIEDADIMILLHPKDQWTSAAARQELVARMEEALAIYPEVSFEFSQPIQLRFNELLSGSKGTIAVKIFGPDPDVLHQLGTRAEALIATVPGADAKLERTQGLRQMVLRYDREALARYGISIAESNRALETAFAGVKVGEVYEGEARYDLVVRMHPDERSRTDVSSLVLHTASGNTVPMSAIARFEPDLGPAMVSREHAQRRITIGVNVMSRSLTEIVHDIQNQIESNMELPPGYSIAYAGEYQNYIEAGKRLGTVVPISLAIILALLYFAYHRWRYALLVFALVPFTTIGGIWMLTIRDMPFSISAGVGFIALFGVGVLNGIVLVSHMNLLRSEHPDMALREVVLLGASDRFRPVMLTAMVATLGFLPMALSTGAGAEVQRPLATVVLGGLVVNTLLTLFLLPLCYLWMEGGRRHTLPVAGLALLALIGIPEGAAAQESIDWDTFKERAMENNPYLEMSALRRMKAKERQGEAWAIAPTNISYGYGQLNMATIRNDFQWNVVQDFGNPVAHARRAKLLKDETTAATLDLTLQNIDFDAALTLAWHEWTVARARSTFAERHRSMLDSLLTFVKMQARQGAITPVEAAIVEGSVVRYGMLATELYSMYLSRRSQAETLSGINLSELLPEGDETFVERLSLPEEMGIDLRLMEGALGVDLAEQARKTAGAALLPSVHAGFQYARLEGIPEAIAWQVGVGIPLWYKADRARLRQAELDVILADRRREADATRWRADYRAALETHMEYSIGYRTNGPALRNSAQNLLRGASAAYRRGETDAYQLVQAVTAATDLQMAYYDLCAQYGQTLIYLYRYRTLTR